MDQLDRDNLLNRLDRLLEWIRACDTKSSIVLAGIGIFITFFTTDFITKTFKTILVRSIKNIDFSNFLYLLLLFLSVLSLMYGIYCLTKVLIPRLSKETVENDGRPSDSLYFFEPIAKTKYREFRDNMLTATKEDEKEDILSQIYVNAKICTYKYNYSRKGMKLSIIGISSLVILYLIGLVLIQLGGF
ncbi:Pycsar system effector family protein (plasmid) [Niallia taxi]|uniref:Pycsar system effector family protein n=1 Tax=Niallia TaxID=2837506 RepID=UPI0015F58CED|nr:Pycsar system effector family protein [Niallia taxi]MED4057167.1 DUF5706 domain-containing protein [Niallia taxi]MED4122145.1 DUF5706 domain-containing protein [Niallia taxi]